MVKAIMKVIYFQCRRCSVSIPMVTRRHANHPNSARKGPQRARGLESCDDAGQGS